MSIPAAVVSVLLGALLFATSGTAQALADVDSTPLGVGAGRLYVGMILLLAFLPAFGSPRRALVPLLRTRTVIAAGLGAAAYQITYFAGVQAAGVALGTLIVIGSVPFFTGALSWIFLKSTLTRVWLVSTAICLVGLALLFSQGTLSGSLTGVLLDALAGLSISVYSVSATAMMRQGGHPVAVLLAALIIGGIMLVPVTVTQPLGWMLQPRGLALVLYLGVFTMVLANWLNVRALPVLGPAPVSTLMLAEPMLATVLGIALLGESIGVIGAVGLAIVLAGLALQSTSILRQQRRVTSASPRA